MKNLSELADQQLLALAITLEAVPPDEEWIYLETSDRCVN
jgi:hypothetical protein